MAQLIVRNLEDELVRRLKIRAAEHGRSAEQAHRDILRSALCAPARVPLKDLLLSMPAVGDDADFDRDDDKGREIDW